MPEITLKQRITDLIVALLPVIFLIAALAFNVQNIFGDDALSGSNQIILIISGSLAAGLGMLRGVSFQTITDHISKNIGDTTKAILIILLIGALAGTWMISGIVPAMIYYGLQVLSAKYFLAASLLICALVSLATGSSWGTTATVGIALIGTGQTMGINEAMVAGAVISGAYFGDKMSPLSDTTNLAPAMAGTDLFSHIRYMTLTTIPSILIALIAFLILGFTINTGQGTEDSNAMLNAIKTTFNITPWLFLVPALVIFLIAKRIDALIAILIGAIGGAIFILIFQPQLVGSIATLGTTPFAQSYEVGMRAMYGEITLETSNPLLTELTSTSGMQGMMGTIWLILSAMIFGGAMEGAGFLNIITRNIMIFAKTTFRLVFSTVSTCLFLNVTASDQYLAIVVPGRMFKSLYDEKGLAAENLSRTLEDSGTVTSVLVPWNTCGAYQSGVLGVATGEYFIYAFFNLISPLMTLIYSYFGIKIKTKTLDNTAA